MAAKNMYKWMLLLGALLIAPTTWAGKEAGSFPTVTAYRSQSCGCCRAWIRHLRQNGFEVVDSPTPAIAAIKRRQKVPAGLQSCHTAVVDGYVIEGHVPAADIRRLLRERPQVTGLAVPGMPAGSPGMEAGPRQDHYAVWTFAKDGTAEVFQTYAH